MNRLVFTAAAISNNCISLHMWSWQNHSRHRQYQL